MDKTQKKIVIWLFSGALLIFIMVVVGGITRLTHSGLSISNYHLIKGALPPIGEQQWQEAFELYKQYPEYQKLNNHFTLEDFKSIYFWEWLHRFIGRLIGMVFFIPFLYFVIRKQLKKKLLIKCILIGMLGALQGFVGWYMVKSGLVDRPDVSHFRLATHLSIAFLTYCVTLWVALELILDKNKYLKTTLKPWIITMIIVVVLQIIWGAFVAGLDAGLIHNHWPMMSEGQFIHHTVFIEKQPVYLNFIEGKSGVQFVHRIGALLVMLLGGLLFFLSRKYQINKSQKQILTILFIGILIQVLIGILTLLWAVPVALGLIHQIGAFGILTILIISLYKHK